jgi:sugar/nucleoside kinase (ribokinase family)
VADISRRNADEVKALMPVLLRYKAHGHVTLGLNENEAIKLADKLGLGTAEGLEALGQKIQAAVPVDCLVIHPRERAVVFEGGQHYSVPGRVVAKPLLSTGGGDHFNAGFCLGLLQGLGPQGSAEAAVRVSGLYVEKGRSPKFDELLASF